MDKKNIVVIRGIDAVYEYSDCTITIFSLDEISSLTIPIDIAKELIDILYLNFYSCKEMNVFIGNNKYSKNGSNLLISAKTTLISVNYGNFNQNISKIIELNQFISVRNQKCNIELTNTYCE